jgi:16S rRNA (cytidine1402-2'-O)-methyltransferase
VQAAIAAGVELVPVPGASAMIAAYVGSGIFAESFRFAGFLPAKSGQRRDAFQQIRTSSEPVLFYEAPHRILASLEDLVAVLGGERLVVIARELTKIHEEFLRGTAQEVLQQLRDRDSVKGEIVLILAPALERSKQESPDASLRLAEIMRVQSLDEKSAMKVLAKELGVGKSELYRELLRTRKKRG